MPHQPRLRDWLGPRAGVLVAVFVYLAVIRTRGISDTFWLLGPIYYWVLWAIRHLVGPVLGGRISPEAQYHAVIGPQGDVRFDLVKP